MSGLREALEALIADKKGSNYVMLQNGIWASIACGELQELLDSHPEPVPKIEWGVAVDDTYAPCKCWHGIAYIPVSAKSREDAQRIIDQTIWQKTSTPHIVKRVAGVSAGPWEPAGHEEREEA